MTTGAGQGMNGGKKNSRNFYFIQVLLTHMCTVWDAPMSCIDPYFAHSISNTDLQFKSAERGGSETIEWFVSYVLTYRVQKFLVRQKKTQ